MPYNPPINRAELKKKGVFDKTRFYNDLAASCGYISTDMAERYYLSFVRMVTSRLKKEGVIRLPHLGDFALVVQKEKLALVGREQKKIPAQKVLKFYPINTWREYFNKLNRLDRT